MVKTDTKNESTRLSEITETKIGTLSDNEVLALLAERKRLIEADEARKKSEAEASEREGRKREIKAEIEKLNATISPEKDDAELLHLVEERKKLEKELESLEGKEAVPAPQEVSRPQTEAKEEAQPVAGVSEPEAEVSVHEEAEAVPEPEAEKEEAIAPKEDPEESVPNEPKKAAPAEADKEFGEEGITPDALTKNGNLERYVHELEANHESLGSFLQNLPAAAKGNKSFMLKVAEIDPAYAMHYADPSLKKDEDFNVRIAATPNKRNSGNALAEMVPEMRTGKVVMAGVRQDYRNVRFVLPAMPEYDEILRIAKLGAMEKVRELKDAADIGLLIPKILQKDKEFMSEVEKETGHAG